MLLTLVTISSVATRLILFKCKSGHVIPQLSTHQWLPTTLLERSKILACLSSLQSSSWPHLWRPLHILLTSLSLTCYSFLAGWPSKHMPSSLLFPLLWLTPSLRSDLCSEKPHQKDSVLSEIESCTLILTLTHAQFYSFSHCFTIKLYTYILYVFCLYLF